MAFCLCLAAIALALRLSSASLARCTSLRMASSHWSPVRSAARGDWSPVCRRRMDSEACALAVRCGLKRRSASDAVAGVSPWSELERRWEVDGSLPAGICGLKRRSALGAVAGVHPWGVLVRSWAMGVPGDDGICGASCLVFFFLWTVFRIGVLVADASLLLADGLRCRWPRPVGALSSLAGSARKAPRRRSSRSMRTRARSAAVGGAGAGAAAGAGSGSAGGVAGALMLPPERM